MRNVLLKTLVNVTRATGRRRKTANNLREDQKTDTISFSARRKIRLSTSVKFVTFQS